MANPEKIGNDYIQKVALVNDSGQIVNPATGSGQLPEISYSTDAFGLLRVGLPQTLSNGMFLRDKQPLIWAEKVNGGTITKNATNPHVDLAVASIGQYAIIRTKRGFTYQPGKSQKFSFTFAFSTSNSITQRAGAYWNVSGTAEPRTGIFLERNQSGKLWWNIYSNGVVIDSATQEDWNLDKFDGTGLSGFTYVDGKPQIAFFDMEYLGVGSVALGFVVDRNIFYTHVFHHANRTLGEAYMDTPNLPVTYSITSVGGAGTMKAICNTVISEGGSEPVGQPFSVTTGLTSASINNNVVEAMIGIRLKAAWYDATVLPEFFSIMTTSNTSGFFALCINPTLPSAATFVDYANTCVQVSVNPNIIVSKIPDLISNLGHILISGHFSTDTQQLNERLRTFLTLGTNIDYVADQLWLIVAATGANGTFYGSMNLTQQI